MLECTEGEKALAEQLCHKPKLETGLWLAVHRLSNLGRGGSGHRISVPDQTRSVVRKDRSDSYSRFLGDVVCVSEHRLTVRWVMRLNLRPGSNSTKNTMVLQI